MSALNLKIFKNFIYLIFFIYFIYYINNKIFKEKKKLSNNNIVNKQIDYYKQLNNIKKMKKVVYTIIFGNYDTIKDFKKQEGYDFYLFTDNISNITYKNKSWKLLPIPDNIKKLNISNVRKQKYVKLHPHLYFKNYDLSIYIDATFIIKGNLDQFLLRIISPKYYLYIFEHPDRNSIYKEIEAVSSLKKEKKSIITRLYKRYIKEKFPGNTGLIEGCFLIRIHNNPECINIMNLWYQEINQYSHRDQLSFNYIKWKRKIKMKYISKNFALQYFKQKPIHLINKIYN